MQIHGNSGDNLRNGSGGHDVFAMFQGGDDTVSGLGGNDVFKFRDAFTAADKVDGGDGDRDRLTLRGDYSAGVVFAADTLVNVEKISLRPGFSYDLTSHDATVAAGQTLAVVSGDGRRTSDTLVFDGSAETDGRFRLIGGGGDDSLTGGAGADRFHVGIGDDLVDAGGGNDRITVGFWNPLDRFDGGGGDDTLVVSGIDGSDSIVLAADSIVGIDKLVLREGFSIETNDSNVAAGETLRVVSQMPLGHSLVFDGAAETDGRFDILGSDGGDSLTGGDLDDRFDLSGGGDDTVSGGDGDDVMAGISLGSADRFYGGAGDDRLIVTGVDGGLLLTFAADALVGIERLIFAPDFAGHLVVDDGNVAAGQTLTVSALQANGPLVFDGAIETDGHFAIAGSATDDTLTGGDQADVFNLTRGGNDSANGGDGDDVFYMGDQLSGLDSLAGGLGQDTVHFDGTFLATLITFTATTMTGVEELLLAAGEYTFVTHDATVAAGAVLTVDGSAIGAADDLEWNGTAETDGAFDITGGAGSGDGLQGGGGDDTLDGGGGSDAITGRGGADKLTGGGVGSEIFQYLAVSDSTGTDHDVITDLGLDSDTLVVAGGVPAGVGSAVTIGSLSQASFNADLAAALAGNLTAGYAMIFTADAGDLSGHAYLVIDRDANAAYAAGSDYVIEITGYTGTLDAGDFL